MPKRLTSSLAVPCKLQKPHFVDFVQRAGNRGTQRVVFIGVQPLSPVRYTVHAGLVRALPSGIVTT